MALTLFGSLSQVIRLTLNNSIRSPNPERISTLGLAYSIFARHYSRNLVWFLFLPVLRCFSSRGSPRKPMCSVYVPWFFIMGVPTFGYLRIVAYLQLPEAFRSLSRPSSAPNAKAFSICSSMLELPFKSDLFRFHSQNCSLACLNCYVFVHFLFYSYFSFVYFVWRNFNTFVTCFTNYGKTWFWFLMIFSLLSLSCTLIRFSMSIQAFLLS